MTTLEVKLDLPDRLAREAQAAGMLTPQALSQMLKDALQRRAAQMLLTGAARGSVKPLSMKAIQAEVDEVRRERRPRKGPVA